MRVSNPGLPAHLLTDSEPEIAAGWDEVVVDAGLAGRGNRAKLHMDRAPWERCVFLDTDTLVTGDLGEGFALLERFDLAAQQCGGGHHYRLPGLPAAFPEYNSGVIFWRRTAGTEAFFRRWRELFDHFAREDSGRLWDQKSFRLALWQCDLRIAGLPANFNLMPYFPAVLERKLVVAHGRKMINLIRLRDRLAVSDELRAYVPGVGVMQHPKDMSWGGMLMAMARMIGLKVRSLLR